MYLLHTFILCFQQLRFFSDIRVICSYAAYFLYFIPISTILLPIINRHSAKMMIQWIIHHIEASIFGIEAITRISQGTVPVIEVTIFYIEVPIFAIEAPIFGIEATISIIEATISVIEATLFIIEAVVCSSLNSLYNLISTNAFLLTGKGFSLPSLLKFELHAKHGNSQLQFLAAGIVPRRSYRLEKLRQLRG